MPSFFVPARSSRHRLACFALYRSLIRQGLRVPLPDELSKDSPLGPANPIRTLIRNGFRRNKRDTSPRLVVSALKNGYRFLALLSRAADASTPEHASVLAFLRENEARVLAVKAKAADEAAKRISTAPIPGRTPIITKVSAEGEPPVYVPTGPPRPLSSFKSGVRKPPTLAAATAVPFLRLKKPQPRFLERVIRQKVERRAKKAIKIMEMQNEGMIDASDEDEWERLVAKMLAENGQQPGGAYKEEKTYRDSLSEAVTLTLESLNRDREDSVARAKALWQIVLAEQEMALKEEKERLAKEGKGAEEPRRKASSHQVRRRARNGGSDQSKKEREKRNQDLV
ncbi:uncharacterized protein P884DRAFT_249769 [Thermothelomyces heterothallicus CBS 202.75]|uniref:uncharacterized protein n=1 Tax=Thermothelomyces heterothallicus CBS 202.75 TaxID=1149848 RepID=UPI003742C69D